MIDYYPYLLRGVQSAANPADPAARRDVYQRAWQIVTDQLRSRQPPLSEPELRELRSDFQAAAERIEREYAPAPRLEPQQRQPAAVTPAEPEYEDELEQQPPARSKRGVWVLAVVAVLVVGIGIGGYSVLTSVSEKPAATTTAVNHEVALREPLLRRKQTVAPSTADLAPGVDGGSTDADLPLVFKRQRVFYRSNFAPGTIVVDKPQHFAYLILPNSTALRYGIGVGESCAELTGLKKIARKIEWPEWTQPGRGPMAGGAGNPLGARLMDLDDNTSRIHGTNAPKTIGDDLKFGCVRLVNDDVADLYNRVPLGASVVMR